MPLRLLQKRRHTEPTGDQAQHGAPSATPLETVLAYHATTKHHPYRSARSLGYMDWDTQPDPFRRYAGAQLLPLDEVPPTPEPSYDAIFQPGAVPPRPLDRAVHLAAFLQLAGAVGLEGIRRQPLVAAGQPLQRQPAPNGGLPPGRADPRAAGRAGLVSLCAVRARSGGQKRPTGRALARSGRPVAAGRAAGRPDIDLLARIVEIRRTGLSLLHARCGPRHRRSRHRRGGFGLGSPAAGKRHRPGAGYFAGRP